MAHKQKDAWYWTHRELSRLICSWDLIPGCPSDEFDSLSFKLLSALQQGNDKVAITRILEAELTGTFGFFLNELDIQLYVKQLEVWWSSTTAR